ncbi:MAG TPA: TylF/MycF/NovP-related O-methyltransferase, partial [Chloroflexota bacterium]|nr:TylF/MycF/NovP-related O-methyltransferase [Chloroflexota bacterium]
ASSVNGNLLSRANLLRFIRTFWQAASQSCGYVLEFGVLNGQSTIELYGTLRGLLTHIYGFDSFAGLPALSGQDQQGLPLMPDFREGNFHAMPADMVKRSILASAHGLQPDQLTLTEGFFSETLPAFDKRELEGQGPCLLAHVDCDLYSSSRDVFRFLDEVVTTGTWLLLDDYWTYRGSPHQGQRRAFDEWMAESRRVGVSEYGSYNGFCKAYVVYEK